MHLPQVEIPGFFILRMAFQYVLEGQADTDDIIIENEALS